MQSGPGLARSGARKGVPVGGNSTREGPEETWDSPEAKEVGKGAGEHRSLRRGQ